MDLESVCRSPEDGDAVLFGIFQIDTGAASQQIQVAIAIDVGDANPAVSGGHGKETGRSKTARFSPVNDQSILLVGNAVNESLLGENQIDVPIIVQIGTAIAENVMGVKSSSALLREISCSIAPVEIGQGRSIAEIALFIKKYDIGAVVIVDIADGVSHRA